MLDTEERASEAPECLGHFAVEVELLLVNDHVGVGRLAVELLDDRALEAPANLGVDLLHCSEASVHRLKGHDALGAGGDAGVDLEHGVAALCRFPDVLGPSVRRDLDGDDKLQFPLVAVGFEGLFDPALVLLGLLPGVDAVLGIAHLGVRLDDDVADALLDEVLEHHAHDVEIPTQMHMSVERGTDS